MWGDHVNKTSSHFEYAIISFMAETNTPTLADLFEANPEATLLNFGGNKKGNAAQSTDTPAAAPKSSETTRGRGGKREGAGRPPLPEDAKKQVSSFTLERRELAILAEFAQSFSATLGRNVSKSEALGIILRQIDDVGLKKQAYEYAPLGKDAPRTARHDMLEGTQKLWE